MNLIQNLNTEAKRIILRAMGNSAAYQMVGRARQYLASTRQERMADNNPLVGDFERRLKSAGITSDLDLRNEQDELARGQEAAQAAFGNGHTPLPTPKELAEKLGAFHAFCMDELQTISENKFDRVMTAQSVIRSQLDNPQRVSLADLEAVAKAEGTSVEDERMAYEQASKMEAHALLEQSTEIVQFCTGLANSGHTEAFDELPVTTRYNLLAHAGTKLKDRRRQIKDNMRKFGARGAITKGSASIVLLKDGFDQLKQFADEFTEEHSAELYEASERGANLRDFPTWSDEQAE